MESIPESKEPPFSMQDVDPRSNVFLYTEPQSESGCAVLKNLLEHYRTFDLRILLFSRLGRVPSELAGLCDESSGTFTSIDPTLDEGVAKSDSKPVIFVLYFPDSPSSMGKFANRNRLGTIVVTSEIVPEHVSEEDPFHPSTVFLTNDYPSPIAFGGHGIDTIISSDGDPAFAEIVLPLRDLFDTRVSCQVMTIRRGKWKSFEYTIRRQSNRIPADSNTISAFPIHKIEPISTVLVHSETGESESFLIDSIVSNSMGNNRYDRIEVDGKKVTICKSSEQYSCDTKEYRTFDELEAWMSRIEFGVFSVLIVKHRSDCKFEDMFDSILSIRNRPRFVILVPHCKSEPSSDMWSRIDYLFREVKTDVEVVSRIDRLYPHIGSEKRRDYIVFDVKGSILYFYAIPKINSIK
jgi:hypothetical protein